MQNILSYSIRKSGAKAPLILNLFNYRRVGCAVPELREKLLGLGGKNDDKQDGDILLVDNNCFGEIEHIADDRREEHGNGNVPLASVIEEVNKGKNVGHVEISLVHSGQQIGYKHGRDEEYLHKILPLEFLEKAHADINEEYDRRARHKNRDNAEALKIRAFEETPDSGCIMIEEAV